jgi:hypothetical protein
VETVSGDWCKKIVDDGLDRQLCVLLYQPFAFKDVKPAKNFNRPINKEEIDYSVGLDLHK